MNEDKEYMKYIVGLLILSALALVGYGFITAIIEIIKNIFGWLLVYYAHLCYLQLIVLIGYGKNIIKSI